MLFIKSLWRNISSPRLLDCIVQYPPKLVTPCVCSRVGRRTDPAAYQAKMEARLPETSCCFCRQTFRGYGHNPQPVLADGKVCEMCNRRIVLVARLQAAREE